MRQILLIAAVIFFAGIAIAKYADQAVGTRNPAPGTVGELTQPREPISSGRSLMLDADRYGHFKVDARVEGRPIDFLVDTGASLVTMRESDAARIGIRPMRGDFTATVSTANGAVKAAPFKIDRVEVGGITVYDVPALMLPDAALSQNLLGVSFLSRLRRYEYANGRMVLEQ